MGAGSEAPVVVVVVVMGVAGSGKSTVGRALAAELGWPFFDGDDFHPEGNLRKMRAGTPLDDGDRAPWLDRLAALLREQLQQGTSAVLACSALKARYRARLAVDDRVRFVFLDVDREELVRRLALRRDHFLPAALLDSQLRELEPPGPGVLAVDGALGPPEAVASRIRGRLGLPA